MNKVIFDCDNTFGMARHDIDDGLTLLYLLGQPQVDLLGVTLTSGNSSLANVFAATSQFKRQLNLSFPLYCDLVTDGGYNSGGFLAQMAAQYPHQLTIIATGALTNLYAAAKINVNFFEQVKQIIVMGGITQPLIISSTEVKELNFSTDPEATAAVLLSGATLTVMNGHMTGEAIFSAHNFQQLMQGLQGKVSKKNWHWLNSHISAWCQYNQQMLGYFGFCNWDMAAAVYLMHPELLTNEKYYLAEKQPYLNEGKMMFTTESQYEICMPKHILDLQKFNHQAIEGIIAGLS